MRPDPSRSARQATSRQPTRPDDPGPLPAIHPERTLTAPQPVSWLQDNIDSAEGITRVALHALCLAMGCVTILLLGTAWSARLTEPRSEPDREAIIVLVASLAAATAVLLAAVSLATIALGWVRPSWLWVPVIGFLAAVACPLSLLVEGR